MRLRDPAGLQFLGSDPSANQQTADALAAQPDGVAGLQAQAQELASAANVPAADVRTLVDDYAAATRDALEQVRSGQAPALP